MHMHSICFYQYIYFNVIGSMHGEKKKEKKKKQFYACKRSVLCQKLHIYKYMYVQVGYVCVHTYVEQQVQYSSSILGIYLYVLLVWLVCACRVLCYSTSSRYLGTQVLYTSTQVDIYLCELSKIDRFPECGKNILPYLEQRSNQYDNWQRQQVCN